MTMSKPIVWLIDDNIRELQTHQQVFELIFDDELEIKIVLVRPHLNDYLDLMQNNQTACLIIDQKISDTGIATSYNGIELAKFLRDIDHKIPIYILTKFVEEWVEFAGNAWSVEEVLDKGDFVLGTEKYERNSPRIKARILRRIHVYKEQLSEQEKQFDELLRKSLHNELNEADYKTLEDLQLKRSSAVLAEELGELETLDDTIKAYQKLLTTLKGNAS